MPLPPRRLLAGSAVAGLLFLLPVGAPANAQDNRNTGGWVQTGGVVLSFIAAVGGATAVSAAVWRRLSKPGAEGKRDDDKLNALLARFDQLDSQLDSSVKEIDTELKRYINNGVNELTGTLGNKIDNLSDNLKTVNSENEKALNDLNEEVSVSLEQCEDEKESLKVSVEEKERRLELQESNKDKQWKIMKDLCKNDKDNQKQVLSTT
ncbi:MAG: hypothetical protein OXF67_07410 [Cyanobacteria bacterium MAG CAR4_bin_6]|nr:hypothetical protein [Cyanobacteria bacterium MAG CAR4_bin_6]